jgi:hypothetical protein
MPIRLTDNLAYPNRGTVSQAMAYAVTQRADRQVFLHEYFTELYRLCYKYQLDFSILVAQSANETGKWKSAIWNEYGNPAGIGVTGSDVSSGPNESLVYENGKDAARAHVVHMAAYVRGAIPEHTELYDYIEFDPRYDAVFEAGYDGTIRRIQDFNVNGKWALLTKPPPYGQRIVNDGLAVWPSLPNQSDPPVEVPTTPEEPMPLDPEVLKPDFVDAFVTKRSDGQGFNYGTRGPIDLLVVHERQGRIGTAQVGRQFFACLTDTSCEKYGICRDGERCQNALVDWEILRNGTLVQYQDPYETNRIPWASGGPENNGTIGAPINRKYRGVFGGINKVAAAVEIEKTDGEACSPEQIQTVGRLMAYVMAKRGYPANDWEYPDVLGGNIYTVPHHSDVSQTSCRIGDSDKAAMKAVCSKLLAAYYQGTTPGEEPNPEPPKPVEEIIPGVDFGIAKRAFDNPALPGYVLTKGGKLSELYIARVKQTGQLPKLIDRWAYDDGRVYYPFSNGDMALFNDKDKSIRWIDEEVA